jgi:hypothetical protein
MNYFPIIQCDKIVSVHLYALQQVTPLSGHTSFLPQNLVQSDSLAADRQGQGDTRLTIQPVCFCSCIYMNQYVNS